MIDTYSVPHQIFLEEYLKIAVMEGVVEPLYPDKPKHPKQKYRLTEKGKALLK